VSGAHPIAVAAAADAAATCVVFAFSAAFRNASFYDAYWSVAPIAITAYWALAADPGAAAGARQVLVLALVALWGVRLTWNWTRGWTGLDHEDWRYVDLRARSGRAFPLVNLLGIHLAPTVLVFLGLLPAYVALAGGSRPLGLLDAVAALATLAAVGLEATADAQLRRFRQRHSDPGETLTEGLWSLCRHPNYLGENLFWWGLGLFGLAADPAWWWTLVGPLSITLLFVFGSIPMIDRRMLARRRDYGSVMDRIPALVPSLRSARAQRRKNR
jgi:steroid 5-alpha reductase family enzyme